jgi:hypothetical protein
VSWLFCVMVGELGVDWLVNSPSVQKAKTFVDSNKISYHFTFFS